MSDAEIIKLFREGLSCSQIAAKAGHPPAYVHRIIVGSWSDADACKEPTKAKGAAGTRRNIPDETVRRIRSAKGRMNASDTARAYGVSKTSVRRIWIGETHKEVK